MIDIDKDLIIALIESTVSINSIKKLNNILKNFKYGYIKNNIPYEGKDLNKYKTINPKDFKKYKIGTCWDYTAYEYLYFKKHFSNLKIHTYFIQEDNSKDNPSHTWLSFELNKKFYIFEASWKSNSGIFKYNSEDKMIKDYAEKFIKNNKSNFNTSKFIVLEFDNPTRYGLSSRQYLKYIYNNSKVILNHGISNWNKYY